MNELSEMSLIMRDATERAPQELPLWRPSPAGRRRPT